MNTPGMEQLFNRIQDATIYSLGDTPVNSAEMYLAWHAQQITSRRIARVWRSDLRPQARIEHGRWLVDCVACSTVTSPQAAMAHPDWRLACCGECGAVYDKVQFPMRPVRLEIERLLLFRARENRNWFPLESVDDIRQENRAHGVKT